MKVKATAGLKKIDLNSSGGSSNSSSSPGSPDSGTPPSSATPTFQSALDMLAGVALAKQAENPAEKTENEKFWQNVCKVTGANGSGGGGASSLAAAALVQASGGKDGHRAAVAPLPPPLSEASQITRAGANIIRDIVRSLEVKQEFYGCGQSNPHDPIVGALKQMCPDIARRTKFAPVLEKFALNVFNCSSGQEGYHRYLSIIQSKDWSVTTIEKLQSARSEFVRSEAKMEVLNDVHKALAFMVQLSQARGKKAAAAAAAAVGGSKTATLHDKAVRGLQGRLAQWFVNPLLNFISLIVNVPEAQQVWKLVKNKRVEGLKGMFNDASDPKTDVLCKVVDYYGGKLDKSFQKLAMAVTLKDRNQREALDQESELVRNGGKFLEHIQSRERARTLDQLFSWQRLRDIEHQLLQRDLLIYQPLEILYRIMVFTEGMALLFPGISEQHVMNKECDIFGTSLATTLMTTAAESDDVSGTEKGSSSSSASVTQQKNEMMWLMDEESCRAEQTLFAGGLIAMAHFKATTTECQTCLKVTEDLMERCRTCDMPAYCSDTCYLNDFDHHKYYCDRDPKALTARFLKSTRLTPNIHTKNWKVASTAAASCSQAKQSI